MIKSKEKLIKYFLYLQPFLDVLGAFFTHHYPDIINVSLIIRSIFLLIAFILILFSNNRKVKLYSLLIIIYMAVFIVYKYFNNNGYLLYEITSTIKTFYFIFMLLFLYVFVKDNNIKLKDFSNIILIYLCFIIIPIVFNFGYESYEITKEGSVGLFYSANDISIILCIFFPILILDFMKNKNYIAFISLVLTCVCSLIIGTKSILLAILITLFILFIYYIVILIKNKKYKILSILFIFIVISICGLILILPKTNFYKNIIIHLEFLNVKSIGDILFNFKTLDHFIFSQRLSFLGETNKIFINSNYINKFIGLGYVQGTDLYQKRIEMDFFDIFYSHGIVGFTIYIYPILLLFKKIIINLKKDINNINNIIISISIILIIILSIIVGHTFTTPTVSFILGCLLIYIYKNVKKTSKNAV